MALPVPTTLLPAHASNPYRTVKHPKLGHMTVLERSFALGAFDQIEYWFEQGVVREALAGQSPSKRDFGRTLMDYLGAWVKSNPHAVVRDRARAETALDALWHEVGYTRKEAWPGWLALMPETTLADRLLDQGVDPWKRPRWEAPNISETRKKNPADVELNFLAEPAVVGALKLLVSRQSTKYRIHYENDALIARIDRMINTQGLPHLFNSALGHVIRGGLLARMNYHMRDHTLQRETPQDHVMCWERWREQLLARGANIELNSEGGFIRSLAECAPNKPLDRWDVSELLDVTRKARQEEEANQAPSAHGRWHLNPSWSQDKEREVLLAVVGRRGLAWERWSHAWLDQLLPSLAAYNEPGLTPNTSMMMALDSSLSALLDTPGGTPLVRRLAGALKKQGYPLPWEKHNDFVLGSRRLGEWVSVDSIRSQRRLDQLLELDGSQDIGNFSVAWRNQLAKKFLGCSERNAKDEDTTPGLMLEMDLAPGYDRRKIEAQLQRVGAGNQPKAPTAKDLERLLDLAGPQIEGLEAANLRNLSWVGDLLQMLPWRWEDSRTSAKERRAVLDLLAQRRVLEMGLGVFEPLDDLGERISQAPDKGDLKAASSMNLDIVASWFTRWAKSSKDLLVDMDQALERLGQQGQLSRARLRRGSAWALLTLYPSDLAQGIPDTFLGRSLAQEIQQDPRLIDLACRTAQRHIASSSAGEWSVLVHSLNVLRSAQVLGWDGRITSALVRDTLTAALQKPDPNEEQIDLIWDVLSHNPHDREAASGQFLVGLLGEESAKQRSMLAWGPMAERLVEASGWDLDGQGEPAELGTLLAVVMAGQGRKVLRQVAQQTLERDLPVAQTNRPGRRF